MAVANWNYLISLGTIALSKLLLFNTFRVCICQHLISLRSLNLNSPRQVNLFLIKYTPSYYTFIATRISIPEGLSLPSELSPECMLSLDLVLRMWEKANIACIAGSKPEALPILSRGTNDPPRSSARCPRTFSTPWSEPQPEQSTVKFTCEQSRYTLYWLIT